MSDIWTRLVTLTPQQQRKLERLFTIAVRKSAIQRSQSEKRLERLQFLRAPQVQTLRSLPDDFLAMYDAVTSLPPHDPSSAAEQLSIPLPEPGKRLWETNKAGYVNWAIEQLLLRTKERDQGGSSSAVGAVATAAGGIGTADDVRATVQTATSNTEKSRDAA